MTIFLPNDPAFAAPGVRRSDKDRAVELARRVVAEGVDPDKILLARELLRALVLSERG